MRLLATELPIEERPHRNLKILIGLGNPGPMYRDTRHNVGFSIIDFLVEKWQFPPFRMGKKCEFCRGIVNGDPIILAKPQTFMNLSGVAVRALSRYYQVAVSNILVIVDDIDIPFGSVRYRKSGSAGTHNGLRSIVGEIGPEFPRIRIGIGPVPADIPLDKYVLGCFSPTELAGLPDVYRQTTEILGQFTAG